MLNEFYQRKKSKEALKSNKKEKKEGKKRKNRVKNNHKKSSNGNSITKIRNITKENKLSANEVRGSINNCVKNQNNSIIKEEKNDSYNIIINKDSINFDINSFLNEYQERVNGKEKEKENKDYIIREEEDNNGNSDNNS